LRHEAVNLALSPAHIRLHTPALDGEDVVNEVDYSEVSL
jgi:hypothetical protein